MAQDTLSNNKRIAKNTLMLYIRMLFLMFISLYTSRVVLEALGVDDYGVYNAVGGFIAMFGMISNSLTAAISRFITYVLGEGDEKKLHQVFCTSVIIQIALALIIALLIEGFGVWFLNAKMSIPDGRYTAANWVLQFSLITFVFNLFSTPYNAAIIAHEKMGAFAFIGIFEGLANLTVAFLLLKAPLDRLVYYALLMCLVAICVRMIYTLYCKRHFKECHFHWVFNKGLFKEMFGFAGWNFVGSISGLLRSQGINMLFNVYNGPAVNAARGLAVQVSTAVTKFSSSFYAAVQPQITKSFASGKGNESSELALRSSRLAFCLLLLLSIPVIFEAEYLLGLWLKTVPEHTVAFVQIIVFYSLFESLSQPLIQLMLATGNIKKYQLVVGGINLLNFPMAWLILYFGFEPEVAQLSVIIFTFMALWARLHMLHNMVDFPSKLFFTDTTLRSITLLLACMIVPMVVSYCMPVGLLRFAMNVLLTEVVAVIIIIMFGIKTGERTFIFYKLKSFIYK